MPEQLRIALPVLWPSMAIVGAVLLIAWWPRWTAEGGAIQPSRRGWTGALAFGLAFATAFAVVVGGMPVFPPPEKWQWLLAMVGTAAACGLLAGLADRALPARSLLGLLAAGFVGWLFHPIASIEVPSTFRAGVGIATFIAWLSIETSARAHRGFVTPLLLSITFTGLSIVILHGGNANISLLAASISASLGVAAAIGMLLPPLCLGGGASHVLAAALVALAATAWMYGLGSPLTLGLVAGSPLVLRAGELIASRRTGWKLLVIRFACVAVPVGVAIVVAMIAAARQSTPDYGY